MPTTDPRVDDYIAKAPAFAQPILVHLRALVHKGCPEVEESIKWGAPHFGCHGMMCGMSAFKEHCAFGFWNRALQLPDNPEAMGQFGCIRSRADLPKDSIILGYVKEAARLNAAGIKERPAARRARPELSAPPELTAALKRDAAARTAFARLSPSHKREYYEWIGEAKTDATRERRLATTLEWIAEGKPRNWKYMKPATPAAAAVSVAAPAKRALTSKRTSKQTPRRTSKKR